MSQASAPDPSWKGLPSWLVFAFLVLVPPAALVAFARTVTQNPFLTAFLIVGYEVLVLFIRFAGKIWERLETSLADYVSQRITLRVQNLASRYHRRYYQHLVYEHQVFDVKGLSTRTAHDLELEQVFVELSIDPTATHQATADPLYKPELLQRGGHSIWEYLVSRSLASRHLVVVGAPGSGKTTLLKHIALSLAQLRKKELQHAQLAHTLPILLFLRDHASSISGSTDFSLVDAIRNHLQRKWQLTVPSEWFMQRLTKGRCLILLDGLDEVADPLVRRQVADWVQRQMLAFGQNRFVLTSRPYGYRYNPLDGVTVLEVHAFTARQIEQFVQNWYLANELKSWGKDDRGVRMRAQEGAQDLLDRLRQTPALLALSVNPLLLTMIATVHRYRASLPGKRVALYAEICEVFLGKRQEARGIVQELSAAQKQQVLQPLAYHLMQIGKREIEVGEVEQLIAPHIALVSPHLQPTAFLEMVQNTSGLFLEHNPGTYGFAHLTFQEYLAAVHIKERNLEEVLVEQVGNTWWHETIRLYCAQADATALISACLTRKSPSAQALELALECQQEALKIQQSERSVLDTTLAQGIESPNRELRHIIAEALLSRRLQQMVHLREETYIDTSLVTHAEYQLFLDEQFARGISYQPDCWSTAIFLPGSGQTPMVGVRWEDAQAFCNWLTARNGGLWRYRLPKGAELARIENEEKITIKLAVDRGCWTQERECSIRTIPISSEGLGLQLLNLYASERLRARDLERARAGLRLRALNPFNPLGLDRVLTSAHGLDRVLDSCVQDLDLADVHVLDLAIDRALDNAHALDLSRFQDLDLDRARESDLDLAISLVRSRDIDLDLTRDLERARDLDLSLDLARSIEYTRIAFASNKNIFERSAQGIKKISDLFWYIRYPTYTLVRFFRFYISSVLLQSKRSSKSMTNQLTVFERLLASFLDVYVKFALLEERMQGRLPPWEGILLVKEPIKVS